MKFLGSRKLTLDPSFITRYGDQSIYIGVPITSDNLPLLQRVGFENFEHGETVLPSPLGKTTRFNAEGYEIIQKNLPKETIYHMVPWEHDEWHGRDNTEHVLSYIERPYQRYPRKQIFPPSKEISIYKQNAKELAISEKILVNRDTSKIILHYINIFLEVFGECYIYTEDLEIARINVKKVNWKIFPTGHMDSRFFEDRIHSVISHLSEDKQKVIRYRYEFLMRKNPSFLAVGTAGFKGYIVFAFPEKGVFILESMYHGNATYVFNENWESLSKRTKGEILSENLQRDRFIHRNNWKWYITSLLNTTLSR